MTRKKTDPLFKEILNTREAAAVLNVTTQTIKNYIYSGKITALKTPGGHHRVRRSDLRKIGFIIEDESMQNRPLATQWNTTNNLISMLITTVESLVRALDARDIISTGHSSRVSDMACKIGKNIGFSKDQLQELKLGALLHDVGKVGISEVILGKPGKLTDQEFFLVKKHSEIGEQIVDEIGHLKPTSASIRHHHERFDGKGYPDEIGGSDIELNARIISVVDSYDFLRSDLSFRKALSIDAALQEIQNSAGTQFDPVIVDHFVNTVRQNRLYPN